MSTHYWYTWFGLANVQGLANMQGQALVITLHIAIGKKVAFCATHKHSPITRSYVVVHVHISSKSDSIAYDSCWLVAAYKLSRMHMY